MSNNNDNFQFYGSCSSGTLKFGDLFDNLLNLLLQVDKKKEFIYLKYEPEDEFTLESIFDALNELAPKNYYFGAHPGDSSDFGYWKIEEEI
jgi:hypothetical protein